MTIDVKEVIAGLLAGLALGVAFFGGLWFTTRRMVHPGKVLGLVLGSFLGRSLLAVGGLFLIARYGGLGGLLGALAGFTVTQVVSLRLSTRSATQRCPK